MSIPCAGYPFPDVDTTTQQFATLMRMLQDDGVDDLPGSTSAQVTAGTGFTVNVGRFDRAFLGGEVIGLGNPGTITLDAAPPTQSRVDRIVIRVDPNTDLAEVDRITGVPGSTTAPALTQIPGGRYEIAIATITIPAGAANIVAGYIGDTRQFTSQRVRQHTSATRLTPYRGRLAYNHTTGKLEVADGAGWAAIGANPEWDDVLHKPAWTDVTLFESVEPGWSIGRADGFTRWDESQLEFELTRTGATIPGVANGNIDNRKIATVKPAFAPLGAILPLACSSGGPIRAAYIDRSDRGIYISALLPGQDVLSGALVGFGSGVFPTL